MSQETPLSPWWGRVVAVTMLLGFGVLILITCMAFKNAPPIPGTVVDAAGKTLFSRADVEEGQAVFLKHGLMDNGTVWGHGAYMGQDFPASYLHWFAVDLANDLAQERYAKAYNELPREEKAAVEGSIAAQLKKNTFDPASDVLTLPAGSHAAFQNQIKHWQNYFAHPTANGGLQAKTITDPDELRKLTAFFAWTAWVSAAERPGTTHSYTNNFPYEPLAGNKPTESAVLSSAASVVALLGFLALALLAFGKYDTLGWKRNDELPSAPMAVVAPTRAQQATLKFMAFAAVLFLFQVLMGAAIAHYRAEPGDFYGFDISGLFPSNLLRGWHLQSAIFWIATTYVAGALFVGQMLGRGALKGQVAGTNLLFVAFGIVIVGSLLGEWGGLMNLLPSVWFWFGNQGWEYLELGRFWQILMAVGLLFWFGLLWRTIQPARNNPQTSTLANFFLASALAIPVFYIPAFFFSSHTHYTIVDTWRFWIIHLWVEGFFEFFVTVIVAVIFVQTGLVKRLTALRIIYLDAILYFGGGLIGTGHHWYWSGQTAFNMSLGAVFSAIEVVPLTLLTLDAWDFVKVTGQDGKAGYRYKWTFYFLMAVGAWNFVGAGLLGFLINMPIISYFEVGTMLTANHGHAAMMGVFGMLGVAMIVFVLQQCVAEPVWARLEKWVRVAFWGLNGGLLMMVAFSLLPGGVMQLLDVLQNGYWHARSLEYTASPMARAFEWARMPGDLVFLFLGVVPLVIAVLLGYLSLLRAPRAEG